MINNTRFQKRFLISLLILVCITIPSPTDGSSAVLAKDNSNFIRLVQTMESDKTGLSNPAGLAFSSRANVFHVVDAQAFRQPVPNKMDITKLDRFAKQNGLAQIAATIQDPINIAYDNKIDRLIILQVSANQLLVVRANLDGNLDQKVLTRYDIRDLDLKNPQGMTVDPYSGWLYILDGSGPRILCIKSQSDGSFDGAAISEVNLQPSGLGAPRGLAFDPTTGHIHVMSPAEQKLYELSTTGQVVAIRDISDFHLKSPQGMVFASSGDQTDDPQQMSLYLADSGLTVGQNQESRPLQASQMDGQIVELSLIQPAASEAYSFQSSLVRTTNMAAFSPPSPDSSGITYLPLRNTLLMSDGEVEETVSGITHFQGANVWEMTLSGSVVRTANISSVAPTFVPMTDEPNGVAWNPTNGHYLFSDDNAQKIYDLNPGNDGQLGTADDSWTSFGTSAVGSADPEGVTFDTWRNHIFVVDGLNAEVYEFTTAGNLVMHFDVQGYGVVDPESIEFNPESGTLFVLSSSANRIIIETTVSGALLQTIGISAASASAPAGLAYAPASDSSGAKHFYIVDRGIDNNADPNVIDGKMFELTAPVAGATSTPTVTDATTSTVIPTTAVPPANDLIFSDNFEGGNLSAWSASSTNGGNLSVQANAALVGNLGLNVNILNNTAMYLTDNSPVAETHYRARFYFDPNSITMASSDSHNIFYAYSGSPATALIRVPFYYSASRRQYMLNMQVRDDLGTWFGTNSVTLSDAPHMIELEWQAASGPSTNNGKFVFWLDGTLISSITGLDNDSRSIEQIRLGPSAGVNTGTRGIYYLDAFESRRFSYIGPAVP